MYFFLIFLSPENFINYNILQNNTKFVKPCMFDFEIKIQYPFYLSVVHFKKDSIKVNIGDKVSPGQELGLVGNSGVSYIPHLHYTLYIYEESLQRFISVPALF